MFTKAAVFGDLHLGKRSDSPIHNADCAAYIDWFCEQAVNANVDQIIFVGDWFDNRSRLRIDTIDTGDTALSKLRDVAPVTMLVGNHDMFFRNQRSIHSIKGYSNWNRVTVIDECCVIDGVGYAPYLVGTEYLEVLEMDAKYIFGHFELPTFLMNASIEMPNKGQFHGNSFSGVSGVFSGHFHKRQLKVNTNGVPIWYIGSPFGHTFNDVNDKERGMMILEWDQTPVFLDYDSGPLYQRFTTSEIMNIIERDDMPVMTRPTSVLEIRDDIGLSMSDISEIRDMITPYIREARMFETRTNLDVEQDEIDSSIDTLPLADVVVGQIKQIDPRETKIQPTLLIELFTGEYQNDKT